MGDTETVRVKLLGTFSISRGRLSVSEPLVSRESQSWKMLKYLCANCGRTIETEELKRELIFAGNESNISNTLRVRLRRARAILDRVGLGGALDGLILYGGGKYCINPDLYVVIDAREADRLCRCSMDKTQGVKKRLAACLDALKLYGGREGELPGELHRALIGGEDPVLGKAAAAQPQSDEGNANESQSNGEPTHNSASFQVFQSSEPTMR